MQLAGGNLLFRTDFNAAQAESRQQGLCRRQRRRRQVGSGNGQEPVRAADGIHGRRDLHRFETAENVDIGIGGQLLRSAGRLQAKWGVLAAHGDNRRRRAAVASEQQGHLQIVKGRLLVQAAGDRPSRRCFLFPDIFQFQPWRARPLHPLAEERIQIDVAGLAEGRGEVVPGGRLEKFLLCDLPQAGPEGCIADTLRAM